MARIAKKTPLEAGVKFEFMNGNTLEARIEDLPQHIIERLAVHGIAQKVGDSYASAESVDEAHQNASAVWSNLMAGTWATKAAKGGKMVEALHRATGQAYEDCLSKWADMDKAQQAQLKKHPAIKKALADIEAEAAAKAAEAVDDDAPDLSGLFDGSEV